MADELVTQQVALAGGELCVLQPSESAELPDDGEVEWAPVAPYWSVLWRSSVALARELEDRPLVSRRVVELGCGLGAPSLAAARAGASVLATDAKKEALALVARSATLNGLRVQTQRVDWRRPQALVARAPFDLALAADVLYERPAVGALLDLLPRLAPHALLADPGRPAAAAFLEGAARRGWEVDSLGRGVVQIHRLRFA